MHLIDWLIVLLLNGGVVCYGFYLSRGTSSSSDWFLGRRALPWWAIGLSMFATNVDNADLVSVMGKTYNDGLHIISVYAIGSATGGILAAFFVVPTIYRAGFYTNAEYLEARFGVTARVLSALIQIQYRSSMLGLILYAVFVLLTGLQIMGPRSAWALIVGIVICSGIYTAWGGLKSVVWTDALQGIVMMVGVLVIFSAVWHAAGGWTGLRQTLADADAQRGTHHADLLHIGRFDGLSGTTATADDNQSSSALLVVLGWTIIGSGYWTVNHTQTMRLMGARSLWDMRMAALFGVAVSLPVMIAVASLGVFGRALPEMQDLAAADRLYPRMVNQYLGVGLKGLVVAGVVAATISTVDSMGSALSAVFTRDIYARLLVTDREDHHYVVVGRWATICVLLLGFVYLPFILLQKNMLDAFITLIPVFVTPLLSMYLLGVLTPVSRASGIIGLLVGSAYGVFALYGREAPRIDWLPNATWVPIWLTNQWAALAWSLLITSTTMMITTCFSRQPTANLSVVTQSGWLARSREILPPLRDHPFSGDLPWWATPSLYATLLFLGSSYVVFVVFW